VGEATAGGRCLEYGVLYRRGDPDKGGAVVWHNKVGRGGFLGGVHWGMSANGDSLFVPIADTTITGRFTGPVSPGIHALDPTSGEVRWYTPSVADCEGKSPIPVCDQGMSAAITSTDQLVFAGSLDGNLNVYDSRSGEILWSFDTFGDFESVSGDTALGGSIEMVFSLPPKADLARSTRSE